MEVFVCFCLLVMLLLITGRFSSGFFFPSLISSKSLSFHLRRMFISTWRCTSTLSIRLSMPVAADP